MSKCPLECLCNFEVLQCPWIYSRLSEFFDSDVNNKQPFIEGSRVFSVLFKVGPL